MYNSPYCQPLQFKELLRPSSSVVTSGVRNTTAPTAQMEGKQAINNGDSQTLTLGTLLVPTQATRGGYYLKSDRVTSE